MLNMSFFIFLISMAVCLFPTRGSAAAILWQNGEAINFDDTGVAYGINNSVAIVGNRSTRGFVYADGKLTLLAPLTEFASTFGADINDSGFVVGNSWNGQEQVAVVWSPANQINSIGGLAGFSRNTANALNNANQVVGTSENPFTFVTMGFIWQNGNMSPIAPLPGDSQTRAEAINDAGQVVGSSIRIVATISIRAVTCGRTGQR